MTSKDEPKAGSVIGGVDTHKDLHVAAVVHHRDRVLGTRSFPSTRQGYRQMLAWMRSLGELQRVGVESTGSYGAGLLRFMQQAGVTVLEVTAPDKQDRRKRGKNDDLDAQNAAHAAFAGKRTVTPRSRDGMIEERRAAQARLRLVGTEAARPPAGEYRAEQPHAIMPCASQRIRALSARASETSVSPADAARSAARLVGAEMVTSIGQPARTVFSTSS